MALASQAALLDELMGINRNSTSKKSPKWNDEIVCKYYLAGFCPHELFVNTKMSLGPCPKVHDSNLLAQYRKSASFQQVGYENLLKTFLSGFIRDVDRKKDINKSRLESGLLSGTEIAIQKRITTKEHEINETVTKIERLGNEGRIEECRQLHVELEERQRELKYDRIELDNHRRSTKEKQEDVCSVCGAYISRNDPRNSIENHVSGRIHCGYVRINEILARLDSGKSIDNDDQNGHGGEDDDNNKRRNGSHSSKNSHKYHHRGDDDVNDNYQERTNDNQERRRRDRSEDADQRHRRQRRHKHHKKSDRHDRSHSPRHRGRDRK